MATIETNRNVLGANDTTSSTTFVDSGLSITQSNTTLITFWSSCLNMKGGSGTANTYFAYDVDGTNEDGLHHEPRASETHSVGLFKTTVNATTVKVEWRVSSATSTLFGTGDLLSHMEGFGIKGGGTINLTSQRFEEASNESTSSTIFVDSLILVTLPNRAGGKFLASAGLNASVNANGGVIDFRYTIGVINKPGTKIQKTTGGSGRAQGPHMVLGGDLNGDVLNVEYKIPSQTATLLGATDNKAHMEVIEVSS